MKLHHFIYFIAASALFALIWIHPLETLSVSFDEPEEIHELPTQIIPDKPGKIYGIDMTDTEIEYFDLGSGKTLADILGERDVPYAVTLEAAEKAKSVFDVRRMKGGNLCAIASRTGLHGEEPRVSHFIYEIDPVEYVVFDLEDSVKVYRDSKKIRTRVAGACGEIKSSLWAECANLGLDVSLVLKLAEIYAWTVDFHHLQKGDRFQIVYEENFVEDKSVGPGKILAARFVHEGKQFDAFYFENDGEGWYFDEQGRSMKSAFLKAPIKFARISSGYSHRRLHPILKVYRKHLGIDYAAPMGTPVMTVGDGTVLNTGYGKAEGRYVKIRHNSTYTTLYMHLSRTAEGIRPGRRVEQGDVIGFVGSTGLSTGPHLDFRFYKNGKPLNFAKVESPRTKSLSKEQMETFLLETRELADKLEFEDTRIVFLQDEE